MITLAQGLRQAQGFDASDDMLTPARGMIFGLELSAYFWALLFGLSL